MEFYTFLHGFNVFSLGVLLIFFFFFCRVVYLLWIWPYLARRKLTGNGFYGPTPSFPLGNIREMKKKRRSSSDISNTSSDIIISHDIHSSAFPHFSLWQKSYGKSFIYWLGTEPFLYIADPELLKKISAGVMAKSWGKPSVFRNDREPMFGNGLVMAEGDNWVRHRHVITPAFNPTNVKAMANLMVDSTMKMLEKWENMMKSGTVEIDVEREITSTAGEIIAKTSFGIDYQNGKNVFEKLRALQMTLFKTNGFVGVPFSKFLNPRKTLEAKRLGKEIDRLFLSIIESRRKSDLNLHPQMDLLGLLLRENRIDNRLKKMLTEQELIDECKTFFFGGHETTALAITWTMLLLAEHPHWQTTLREEIGEVLGDVTKIDFAKLSELKKMRWVMNEVLRLYPTAPNVQRQARGDIQVGDQTIPDGTNMWIDVVAMHHDRDMWGENANLFEPERFKDDPSGGCKHKMGFLPFGFGGRMCVGRNLTFLEYKIVLTLILSRFSFSLSPNYSHSPSILLSLRPSFGLPLVFQPLSNSLNSSFFG